MAKYRKKPVIIEAEQWFPENNIEGVMFPLPAKARPLCPVKAKKLANVGFIDTLEGGHFVSPGDWIITGIKGEKYPCKPDIFEKTYEPV